MMDNMRKKLGERIRELRKAAGFTQEELGERAELSYKYIGEVERGKVNASIYTFYMITQALGFPFSELVSFSSGKVDKQIETEITEIVALFKKL